jgi:DnaK suppressor protein
MEYEQARTLLRTERARVEQLLGETLAAGRDDRDQANQDGDMADPAERLTAEESDDAVSGGLRERLAAIERAEHRIDQGVYGFSVRSGLPLSDERLEADPAAELSVEEARTT